MRTASLAQMDFTVAGWRTPQRPPRSTALRLFFTCWLIYALHAATNTPREAYLAIALGDRFSFRVDEYAGLHPDLFEKPGFGWHINSNPGGSMAGAIPYALFRPLVDRVAAGVNRARRASGAAEPPEYNSPWPMARQFYAEAWKRGLDVKFGLAGLIMQALCMAPASAAAAVAMFWLLRRLYGSDRVALALSLVYAFGTPVFFRTGYLNHNLLLAHACLLGLLALWVEAPSRARVAAAGLAGGACVLFDYSGVVPLAGLGVFALARARSARAALWYAAGAAAPIALLLLYQWRSFGNPFLPAQAWMPRVPGADVGFRGMGWPAADLLWANLFDYRYGLLASCPLLLLALAAPWLKPPEFRAREMAVLLGIPAGLWLFCSGIAYARLQFNTGVRYLVPAVPFLFLCAAAVLVRLPRRIAYFAGLAAVAQAWCMAMYRDVERGFGILDPVARVFTGGFQLPVLSVLARMAEFREYTAGGVSPLPLFALTAAVVYGIWAFSPRSAE